MSISETGTTTSTSTSTSTTTTIAIEQRFVEANGLRFEVDVCSSPQGDGKTLALCLHGFPEHSHSWRHQLPMLAAAGYQAWAPNLRGYGNSSRPEGIDAYSIEALMEDVGALIDASGCDKTILIAHDWGAVIAWFFAMRKIRPLEKLIICNVPHPAAAADNLGWAQLKKSWYILFFQIPWLPEKLLGTNNARGIGDMFRKSSSSPERFTEDVTDVYVNNAAAPGALTAMCNYYRGLLRGGGMKRQKQLGYPSIEVPTLMVWGEEDVALTKESTYGTDKYVKELTIRYLPRVSHWVQQDAPEAVNAMIAAFLAEHPVPQLHWQAILVPPEDEQ